MGKVHHQRERLPLIDTLQAARHAREGRQSIPDGSQRHALRERHRRRCQAIVDVEQARKANRCFQLAPFRPKAKARAPLGRGYVAGLEVGCLAHSVAHDSGPREAGKVGGGGLVGVEHSHLLHPFVSRLVEHGEQAPLGRHVFLSRAVEVQVIGRDVGHHRHVVFAAVQAVQGQAVGARFQDGVVGPGGRHLGQKGLHLGRLGRGEAILVGEEAIAHLAVDGAQQAGAIARCLQESADEMNGGRLAIRPGDADNPQPPSRMAVEGGRQHRQSLAAVGHHDGGQAAPLDGSLPLRPPVGLNGHRHGAASHCLAYVVMPVGPKAGHGHKQGPRRDPTRITADGRYRHIGAKDFLVL